MAEPSKYLVIEFCMRRYPRLRPPTNPTVILASVALLPIQQAARCAQPAIKRITNPHAHSVYPRALILRRLQWLWSCSRPVSRPGPLRNILKSKSSVVAPMPESATKPGGIARKSAFSCEACRKRKVARLLIVLFLLLYSLFWNVADVRGGT